jgi:soluble lytic murein transglycosylase-like protein
VHTLAVKKALLLTVLAMAAAPALAEDAQRAQAAEPRQAENQGETRTETNGTVVASPSSAPETMCDTLAAVAARHELPADFFIRLIWQESRFNPSAVSFKGGAGHRAVHARNGTATWP